MWYSTCDSNLLVYSVMVSSGVVKQSNLAYKFLKDLSELVNNQIPTLKRELDYISSLENKVGQVVSDFVNHSEETIKNTALSQAQMKVNQTKTLMEMNV